MEELRPRCGPSLRELQFRSDKRQVDYVGVRCTVGEVSFSQPGALPTPSFGGASVARRNRLRVRAPKPSPLSEVREERRESAGLGPPQKVRSESVTGWPSAKEAILGADVTYENSFPSYCRFRGIDLV